MSPLIKSKGKKAFSANVRKEVAAGKPVKQAVAIAFSVKRKAGGKPKVSSRKPKTFNPGRYERTRKAVFNLKD